jgi:membrane protease YdiL (CAAX protease family)
MPPALDSSCNLLPTNKTIRELLYPYLLPYLIYVLIATLAGGIIPIQWEQILKFGCTTATMAWFFKVYRFGPFFIRHGIIALAGLPVALGIWIGPLYIFYHYHLFEVSVESIAANSSTLAFSLKLINAVVLVAAFEELFMRSYLMSWFYQAGQAPPGTGVITAIVDSFEQHCQKLNSPPISVFSVILTTLCFAMGHHFHQYPSAMAYFLFTTWLYYKTRSLWVCIVIHGMTNLAVILLARHAGMIFLL